MKDRLKLEHKMITCLKIKLVRKNMRLEESANEWFKIIQGKTSKNIKNCSYTRRIKKR